MQPPYFAFVGGRIEKTIWGIRLWRPWDAGRRIRICSGSARTKVWRRLAGDVMVAFEAFLMRSQPPRIAVSGADELKRRQELLLVKQQEREALAAMLYVSEALAAIMNICTSVKWPPHKKCAVALMTGEGTPCRIACRQSCPRRFVACLCHVGGQSLRGYAGTCLIGFL